jgi:hypothetical protein
MKRELKKSFGDNSYFLALDLGAGYMGIFIF